MKEFLKQFISVFAVIGGITSAMIFLIIVVNNYDRNNPKSIIRDIETKSFGSYELKGIIDDEVGTLAVQGGSSRVGVRAVRHIQEQTIYKIVDINGSNWTIAGKYFKVGDKVILSLENTGEKNSSVDDILIKIRLDK